MRYIDEVSGEGHPGIALRRIISVILRRVIRLHSPDPTVLPSRFPMPPIDDRHRYRHRAVSRFYSAYLDKQPDWQGQLRLFYGARTGMETLYRNDLKNDLDEYYDQKTFKAFEGLSHRPWMQTEENGLHDVLLENAHDIWEFMQNPKTHVYLAGLPKTEHDFEDAMSDAAGSSARWGWTREEMKEQNRWSELIYG